MRSIGTLQTREEAVMAHGLLISRGIDCRIDQGSGGWQIWVLEEDKLLEARSLFHQFLNDPDKRQYEATVREAQAILERVAEQEQQAEQELANRMRTATQVFNPWIQQKAPLTSIIIGICIAIWLFETMAPMTIAFFQGWLKIVPPEGTIEDTIALKQLWRFITPVFLHATITSSGLFMGILHIGMNMLWMKDLGPIVEKKHGSLYFFVFFICAALVSNLSQLFFAGPNFLGMSGVVYALLGYIWIRGKFDPNYGLRLNPGIVYFMVTWFVLCFFMVGVANYAHGGGLFFGVAWGYISSGHLLRKFE